MRKCSVVLIFEMRVWGWSAIITYVNKKWTHSSLLENLSVSWVSSNSSSWAWREDKESFVDKKVLDESTRSNSKRRSFTFMYIFLKRVGSQPGLPGSSGFRVDRVPPCQLPGEFLLRPGPVPSLGWSAGPVRISKLCFKHSLSM